MSRRSWSKFSGRNSFMARGDKAKTMSATKEEAARKQKKLQAAGASKSAAERRAWDETNKKRTAQQAGTSGGRSRLSKRALAPKGSTSKTKTTGKTRK